MTVQTYPPPLAKASNGGRCSFRGQAGGVAWL